MIHLTAAAFPTGPAKLPWDYFTSEHLNRYKNNWISSSGTGNFYFSLSRRGGTVAMQFQFSHAGYGCCMSEWPTFSVNLYNNSLRFYSCDQLKTVSWHTLRIICKQNVKRPYIRQSMQTLWEFMRLPWFNTIGSAPKKNYTIHRA